MTTATHSLDVEAVPATPGKELNVSEQKVDRGTDDHVPYSIFTRNEKRCIVFALAFAALFSPISSTIYYPALSLIADDLGVSDALINLTITTFMIFQGLAPAFIGAFSDAEGRRPAYVICFLVYVAANIGLALQTNYAALMLLRCLQSSGSSGLVAIAIAVVADISTPHERGGWMGWTNAGGMLGPVFGPIIGGLLSQNLGWRSIFWFLTIASGVYMVLVVLFFPETGRAVVGNGSHRPPTWNASLFDPVLKKRVAEDPSISGPPITHLPLRFPNPILTLALLFDKEASLILFSTGFLFAGFYGLMAVLPSQLEHIYGLDSLQIGLIFLSSGIGGSIAAILTGRLMDFNFRRHARKLGLDPSDTRRLRTLSAFPIEKARIELALPLIVLDASAVLCFGWVMHFQTHLSGLVVLMFFVGHCTTGAFTILSTLTVDLFPERPATATAASNMTRCWLGAGASAGVVPLVGRIGNGWTFTAVAALWLCLCPPLLAVMRYGPSIRKKKDDLGT